MRREFRGISAVLLAAMLASASAFAQQQTTGTPGSPDATTTVDSRYLPPPPQKFEGQIGLNADQSKTAWPARIVPPKGAPNILLILTDDVGFGAPSTFGGIIPTPAMDRIAANGLRYTNFPFDLAVLAEPGRADHRAQPSLGWVRRDLRDRDWLPRLQQRDRQG
jgi:hypothetical protein